MTTYVRQSFTAKDGLTLESLGQELRACRVAAGSKTAVQGNQLVVTTGSAGNYAGDDRTGFRYVKPVGDGELLITVDPGDVFAVPEIFARADDPSKADIPNTVRVSLQYDATGNAWGWVLEDITGTWTKTAIGKPVPLPDGTLQGDPVTIRLRVVGSTASLKVWQAGAAEPSDWSVTGTTTTTAAGSWGILAASDAAPNGTVAVDNLVLTDGVPETALVRDSFTGVDFDGPTRRKGHDLVVGLGVTRIVPITAAEYAALTVHDATALYVFVDGDHSVRVG